MKKLIIFVMAFMVFACNYQESNPETAQVDFHQKEKPEEKPVHKVEPSEILPHKESEPVSDIIESKKNLASRKVPDPIIEKEDVVLPKRSIIEENEDFDEDKNIEESSFNLSEFYAQFERRPQSYIIYTDQTEQIICNEGTVLKIPKNAFETVSGKMIDQKVELQVKEFFKNSDILLANLSTSCDDQILETGGMLHLAVFSNGEECQLKRGKQIEIMFPTKEEKEEMKLFTGEWSDECINWKIDESAKNKNEDALVHFNLDRKPAFPDGNDALIEYINENLDYPLDAISQNVQGTVIISFIVNKNGEIDNVRAVKGHRLLREPAIELVESFPKWTPAIKNGNTVNAFHSLPIRFSRENPQIISSFSSGRFKKERKWVLFPFKKNPSWSVLNRGRIAESSYTTFDYNIKGKEYQNKFELNVNDENISKTDIGEISRYLFSTSNLGWINCDRFVKGFKNRVDYVVDVVNAKSTDVKIIFHNVKSILNPGFDRSNISKFKSVPLDEPITIVAIKKEKGNYYLATKNTVISRETEQGLEFNEISMHQLKQEMEKINSIN